MPTRYVIIDGQTVIDPRQTRAWRRLVVQVVREEPLCWLDLRGCTQISTTGDHVIPVVERPDLALVRDNVRGACRPCNELRRNLPVAALDALREPGAGGQASPLSIFDRRPVVGRPGKIQGTAMRATSKLVACLPPTHSHSTPTMGPDPATRPAIRGRRPRLLVESDLQGCVTRLVWAGLRPPLAAVVAGVPASTHHLWQSRGRLEQARREDGQRPRELETLYLAYTTAIDQAVIDFRARIAPASDIAPTSPSPVPAEPSPLELLEQRRAARAELSRDVARDG